jgi:hypothetical protein
MGTKKDPSRGRGKRNPPRSLSGIQPSGLSGTREKIEQAFRERMKTLHCPNCGLGYTDFAVDWYYAWREGLRDEIIESERASRDGPLKLKCELCGHRVWTDVFSWKLTSAEVEDAESVADPNGSKT